MKNIKLIIGNKLKYLFISFKYNYSFLKVLNSPFKSLKLTFYFGKIVHGTPYFLPRKWVKATPKLAHEATLKQIKNDENFNKRNPQYARIIKSYEEIFNNKMKCEYPISIKYFHWTFTSLGWKTKWTPYDYRFEWSPSLSIVIFGKQLFISIIPNIQKYKRFNKDVMNIDCYWESWLNWEYNTDKTKSKEERFKKLVYKHSNTWDSEKDGWTDYYYHILNKKYLKLYEQILENKQSNN